MNPCALLVGATLLVAPVLTQRTVTFPAGFDATESYSAPAASAHPFYAANARWQLLYTSARGSAYVGIQKLELRRDGGTAAGVFPARTTNLVVLFAHGEATTFSTQFSGNYVGTPVKVVSRKGFNLPDLSAASPSPAPWGVAIPFDAALTFDYDGGHDLLVEFQCDGTTPVDKSWPLEAVDSGSPGIGQVGFFDGFGYCTTQNGQFLSFPRPPETSSTGTVTIASFARGAPNNAPGALGIGLSDPNLPNIFCAKLRTSAELLVPVTASALGEIGTPIAPLVLQGPFAGPVVFYMQYVALDPLQAPKPTVALSDAAKVRVVAPTASVRLLRLFSTSATLLPTAMSSGQRSPLMGLVMRLTYP